jgi:AraC family transcriptional regulator
VALGENCSRGARVTIVSRVLACGPDWRVTDVLCDSGPQDPVFEERHDSVNIAIVSHGTFHYRAPHGGALLGPGSLLLGNYGACFECAHEHARGDHCLAFHFSPGFFEEIARATPGVSRAAFTAPRLPPSTALAPLVAEAELARRSTDAALLEELALRLAAAVMALLEDAVHDSPAPGAREEKRISEALRRIAMRSDEALSLRQLANDAAMSPSHFLRVFRRVAGVTPHQFILHHRIHRASICLRDSRAPISTIALECGFADLSNFNHRFRQVMGKTPGAFRAGAR